MRRGRAGSWPTTESSTRAGPDHFMRSPGRTSRWNLSVLHPEQVAQLQKKPVRRAAQISELERLRLGERRAVAQEYDGAGRRLVGEQQVVPEVVRHDRSGRAAVHDERLPRVWIEQLGLVLREVLPDVAHEDRACQLILELESGDVRGREAAAVARAGEALVHPARLDTQRGRGAEGGDGGQGDLPSLGGFGEDGLGRVAYHHTPRHSPVRCVEDERRAGELIQVVGQGEGRASDGVARVIRGLEAEVIQVERDLRLPAAPQVRDPERLYGVFDCPVQPAEVAVAPDRGESENHRELLDQRSRTAVPAEPVEGAARDEVSAIHEPARILEALLDAQQLEMVTVRATGAVAEGDGPQLARAGAAQVPRPRPGDLHFREPDLAPHDVRVDA